MFFLFMLKGLLCSEKRKRAVCAFLQGNLVLSLGSEPFKRSESEMTCFNVDVVFLSGKFRTFGFELLF